MNTVYLLWHVRKDDEFADDAKLIGVYGSAEKAAEARGRVAGKPGFAQHPEGFLVEAYRLDEDQWTEGFGMAQ